MARVTHVKRAQQRYATKPVLDAEGKQVQVPMINKRTGQQKTTKGGRPVFLGLTERDLTQPKPMPRCGKCGITIEVGQPYKWIEPHGRGQLVRCAQCPTWQVWEYSSSLSARIAEIQHEQPGDFDSVEEAQDWATERAQAIRDLAEEKRESASNMEEGFGHETEQSAELNDIADQLDEWADEVEGAELPEYPEPEEDDCEECDATGMVEGTEEACDHCGGSGQVTPDEPTEEQLDTWREEVRDALQEAMDNCPL